MEQQTFIEGTGVKIRIPNYIDPALISKWAASSKSIADLKARLERTRCVEPVTVSKDLDLKNVVKVDFKKFGMDFKIVPNKKHYAAWKFRLDMYDWDRPFSHFRFTLKNDFILFGSLISNLRLPRFEQLLMNQFEKMGCKFDWIKESVESHWRFNAYMKLVEGDLSSHFKYGLRFDNLVERFNVNMFRANMGLDTPWESNFYLKLKQKDKSIVRDPVPRGYYNEFKLVTTLGSPTITANRFKILVANRQFYYNRYFGDRVCLEVLSKTLLSNFGAREFLSERGFPGDLSELPISRRLSLSTLVSFKLHLFLNSYPQNNGIFPFVAFTFFSRNFNFLTPELSIGLEKRLSQKLGLEFIGNVLKSNFQIRLVKD